MSSNETGNFYFSPFEGFGSNTIAAIGRLVTMSSRVEFALHLQVQRLISDPEPPNVVALSVLHGAAVGVLLAQIVTLAELKVGPVKAKFVKDTANELRTEVARCV